MKYRQRLHVTLGTLALVATIAVLMVNHETFHRVVQADESTTQATPFDKVVTHEQSAAVIKEQMETLEKNMKSAGTFRRAMKKVETGGRMLAILGNIEAARPESGDAAKKGASLRQAGLALAEAAKAKSYEDAEKAYTALKSYPDKIEPSDETKLVAWDTLTDMDFLMNGVSAADSETKKVIAAKEADFKKGARSGEANAYLLAVLGAVAAEFEPDDDWKQFSRDMTKHSQTLAADFAKKDQSAAKSSRETLYKSCEACHEVYHDGG